MSGSAMGNLSSSQNCYPEIVELFARFYQAADRGDAEAWADCFTEDGELYSDGKLLSKGRDEHVAIRRAASAANKTKRQHWSSNIVLTRNAPDRVACRSYFMTVELDPSTGKPAINLVGSHEDDIVLTDKGWKFARKNVSFLVGDLPQTIGDASTK